MLTLAWIFLKVTMDVNYDSIPLAKLFSPKLLSLKPPSVNRPVRNISTCFCVYFNISNKSNHAIINTLINIYALLTCRTEEVIKDLKIYKSEISVYMYFNYIASIYDTE